MKGDKFREMAAKCGDLPDSVMAVPGLEYVGEKSAEWEALCVRAAAWANEGPERMDGSWPDEHRAAMAFYRRRTKAEEDACQSEYAFAGLALFARLMATVMREE